MSNLPSKKIVFAKPRYCSLVCCIRCLSVHLSVFTCLRVHLSEGSLVWGFTCLSVHLSEGSLVWVFTCQCSLVWGFTCLRVQLSVFTCLSVHLSEGSVVMFTCLECSLVWVFTCLSVHWGFTCLECSLVWVFTEGSLVLSVHLSEYLYSSIRVSTGALYQVSSELGLVLVLLLRFSTVNELRVSSERCCHLSNYVTLWMNPRTTEPSDHWLWIERSNLLSK